MPKRLRLNYDNIAKLLSITVLILIVTVIVLFALSGKEHTTKANTDWYNSNWSYRQKVTIDNTKVPNTDQTDFPVYIDLSDMSSGFFTNVKSDGSDIVVTSSDGVTKLDRELVSITTGSSIGELWFKAPTLSNSVDTDFWIYYGNSSASETNSTNVWSNGYEMVQHMNEDPSGSSPQLKDSTDNSNDGTSSGSMTTGDLVAGQLDDAIDFDGTDDYFTVSDDPFDFTSSFTVTGWNYYTQNTDHNMVIGNLDYSGNTGWLLRSDRSSETDGWAFFIGNSEYNSTASSMTLSQWLHVTVVYDDVNDTVTFYKDGATNGVVSSVTKQPVANTNNLEIGKEPGNSNFEMSGMLDEMRVIPGILSGDWITTEYNNQSDPDTFYTTNTEEAFTVGWYNSNWGYRQKITIDSSNVPNTDQNDFPVYVDLSELSSFMFDTAKSDGSDLVVTGPDGTTKLSRELVEFDTANYKGELWFKAPVLSSSFDSEFYIYYGNSAGSETNDTAVWSNGIEMVQHMNEDPSGSAPQIVDSTINSIDGTSSGSMTSGDLISGKIGNSLDFDDSNDFIDYGTGAFDIDNGSMSIWVKVDGFSSAESNVIFSQDASGHVDNDFLLYTNGASSNKFSVSTDNGSSVDTIVSDSAPTIGEWSHVAVSWGIGGVEMYVNGSLQIDTSSRTDGLSSTSASTELGARDRSSFYFNGDIDNWTVYSEVKDIDWIVTEYNNQSDTSTFYDVSLPEANSGVQWYDQSWGYREKITIDNTKVSTNNQLEFPVYIDLSDMSANFFSKVKSDGSDIVVTYLDGTSKLKRELVSINTGGSTGQLWFRAPMLDPDVDTEFYIYYGKSTASETNDTSVWEGDYKLVQHGEEDPSGSAPQMTDSTSNNNDGTSNGTMTTGDIETGQIGNSIDYDASNDYIDYGTGINGTDDKLTVSAWINPDALVSGREYHILDNGNGYLPNVGTGGSFALTTYNSSTTHKVYMYVMNNSSSLASANGPVGGQITSGSWYYVTGVYDGSTIKVYVNGVEKASSSQTGKLDATVSNLTSGRGLGGSQYYTDGNIEEVRLSGTSRDVSWILTEYNNQSSPSTFYSVAAVETGTVCPAVDGGTNDDDLTVDGTITIQSNQQWDATAQGLGILDCTGLDIIVKGGYKLTLNPVNDNDEVYTDDFIVTLRADNIEVESSGIISSDLLGYDGGNGTKTTSGHANDGFGPGYGGGTANSGNSGGSGGSYGGKGTKPYNTSSAPTEIYDTPAGPDQLGSGGGMRSSFGPGGAGGGGFKLDVSSASGTVTVNGELTADGEDSVGQISGGGSGGAIWIVTDTIAGSGTITAVGGDGGIFDSNDWGGSGGGGRIHVEYNTSTYSGTYSSVGGSMAYSTGENGSLVLEDLDDNDLIIQQSQRWIPDSSSAFETWFSNITDVTVQSSSNWKLQIGNNKEEEGANSGYGWTFDVTNFTINSGSSVNGDGLGYHGGDGSKSWGVHVNDGYGPGYGGGTSDGGNDGGSGGSYGGLGTKPYDTSSAPTDIYDTPINPTRPGSGGGMRSNWGPAGNGGSQVKITTSNTLTINGDISMDGANSSGQMSGGGSGGGIWIVTDTITGSANISTNGGNGGVYDGNDWGGSGGGGRILVDYDTSTFTGTLSSTGGVSTYSTGEDGTVILHNKTNNTLYIDHDQRWRPDDTATFETWFPTITDIVICSASSTDTECENGLDIDLELDSLNKTAESVYDETDDDASPSIVTVPASATFEINDTDDQSVYETTSNNVNYYVEVHDNANPDHLIIGYLGDNTFSTPNNVFEVFKDVERTTRGWRGDYKSFAEATPANWTYDIIPIGIGWDIDVTNLIIDSGSSINTNENGYAGSTDSHYEGYGPGGGSSITGGGSGGSYGGEGGPGASIAANQVYEIPIDPMRLGSGGSQYTGSYGPGGAGGGAVKINVTNNAVINGSVNSDGQNGQGNISAGGSGGSVWLSVASALSGSGSITADGGNSSNDNRVGGGGGGRIFIEYGSSTFSGTITAAFGEGTIASRDGENGTVVLVNNTNTSIDIENSQRWVAESDSAFEDWFSSITNFTVSDSSILELDSSNKLATSTYDETNDDGSPSIVTTSASATYTINDTDELIDYKSTSGKASYYLEVHDNANPDHMIWGYLGDNSFSTPNNVFEIYSDLARTTRGWKGDISSFQIESASSWTYDITQLGIGWDIGVTNFTVELGSTLSANELGHSGGVSTSVDGYGRGGGQSLSNSGENGGSGGSNGGKGGDGRNGSSDEIVEVPTEATVVGSGGGVRDVYGPGGAGGGSIKITTTNNITLNGTISAEGQDSPGLISGGGSGGSIWLKTSNIFTGSGTISAQGGNGGTDGSSNRGGAGGGGKVFVDYSSSSFVGTINADGAQDPPNRVGEDGSVVVKNSSNNKLIIDNDQRWLPEDQGSFEKWFPSITDVLICSSTSVASDCLSGNDVTLELDTRHETASSTYDETDDSGSPSIVLADATASITINDTIDLSDFEAVSGGEATYYIEIEDGETPSHKLWGFIGQDAFSSPNNVIEIYRDVSQSSRGWKGDVANFVTSTPANWTYDIENIAVSWRWDVTNLTVDSGSLLSLSDLGYEEGLGGTVNGYGPAGGGSNTNSSNNGGAGASNGGKGMNGDNSVSPEIYDIPIDPKWVGSGGGSRTAYLGSNGSGALELNISNNLIVNGSIEANANQPSNILGGGGAGGSFWFKVDGTLSGNGSISVDGGSGGSDGSGRAGAGGGGRIHIEYAASTYTGTYSATGGTYPSSRAGEDGSILLEYTTGNDLFLSYDQRWIPETTNSFEEWFPSINDVTVGNSSTLYLDTLNKTTDDEAFGWNLDLTTLTVSSGATLGLDSLGYEGGESGGPHVDGYGPGGGGGTTSSVGASGGGHGGEGAQGSNGSLTPGPLYGNISNPITPGSGGGAAECAGQARGRHGGGAIKITTSSTVTLDGDINADGEDAVTGSSANGCRSGGGAGGSVWIDTTTISGSGNITAVGGNGGRNGDAGGTGAGGRVSIQYNTNSFTGLVSVIPGQIPSSRKAEDGTNVFEDKPNQHLYVYTTQKWVPTSSGEFETLFPNVVDMTVSSLSEYDETDDGGNPATVLTTASATFTVNDSNDISEYATTAGDAIYVIVVDDNEATNHKIWGFLGTNNFSTPNNVFDIYDNKDRSTRGWLGDSGSFVTSTPANWTYDIYKVTTFRLASGDTDQTSGGYGWAMGLDDFTLDYGHYISGDELGYDGGISGSTSGKGAGGGTGTTIAGYGGGGGGHGGAGATGYASNVGGTTYDVLASPVEPGSGGGTGECNGVRAGEPGGSAIKIAAETGNIWGDITMNGGNGPTSTSLSCRAGGGAGGSIWLLTDTLNGSGDLFAEGGDGGNHDGRGGAGGGGRIAIKYCTNNWTGSNSVTGGQIPSGRQGSAGTFDNNSATLGYITSLDSGLDAYLASDWSTDLENASNTQYCIVRVGIADNDNSKRIADFDVFFDSNLNFSNVVADTGSNEAIFYISGGFENIAGYQNTHPTFSIYAEKGTATRVGVCESATVIGDVDDGCSGLYYLEETDTNASVVDIGGTDYWKVDGMTNGGIFSEILNTPPVASSVTIDSGASSVTLTEGTTTTVSCTGTVTDTDGFGNILSVEAILYRTGVGSGAADNDNNHYTLTGNSECVPSNGSGSTEDYTCDFDVEFHAEPTDASSPNSADNWTCVMTPSDGAGAGTSDSDTIELNTLFALGVTSSIAYGQIDLGEDTGATNQSTTLTNTGNDSIDVDVSGADMCTDYPTCSGSVLGATYQKYAETTFTYGAGGTGLTNSAVTLDLSINKPTSSPSTETDILYWGIGISGSQNKGVYSGVNVFTAVTDT